MAKVEQSPTTSTLNPNFMVDFLDREHLLPGGARLAAADFTADASGRKPVIAGTIVGRTRAERDAGTGYGPAAALDEEIYIVAFDCTNALDNPDVELVRHFSGIKENKLPGGGLAGQVAGIQTAVRAVYECTIGAD